MYCPWATRGLQQLSGVRLAALWVQQGRCWRYGFVGANAASDLLLAIPSFLLIKFALTRSAAAKQNRWS